MSVEQHHRTYATAKGFCQCAFSLITNPIRFQTPNDTTFVLGFHHLIGFAVELYLKAFLIARGMEEKKLYSHNLMALLKASEEYGLECPAAYALCDYLKMHKTFEYRYMQESSVYNIQKIDITFDQLSTLDNYVDEIIGASASLELVINRRAWKIPSDFSVWRV